MANRWTYYIDKEGIVRHIDGKDRDNRVNVGTHGEDIAKKLEELKFPKKKTDGDGSIDE
jgi:hypothetical protein